MSSHLENKLIVEQKRASSLSVWFSSIKMGVSGLFFFFNICSSSILVWILKVIMGLTSNAPASRRREKKVEISFWMQFYRNNAFPSQTLILYLQTGLYWMEPTFQGKWPKRLHFSESCIIILFGIRRKGTQLSEFSLPNKLSPFHPVLRTWSL